MLKISSVGLLAILVTSGSIAGYQWHQNKPAEQLQEASTASYETIKTDFVSIAIFDKGKVDGYFTFRAEIGLSDPSRSLEVEYLITNFINVNQSKFPLRSGKNISPNELAFFEKNVIESISPLFKNSQIYKFKMNDIAYDKRNV